MRTPGSSTPGIRIDANLGYNAMIAQTERMPILRSLEQRGEHVVGDKSPYHSSGIMAGLLGSNIPIGSFKQHSSSVHIYVWRIET
jgi:hypothetical protein